MFDDLIETEEQLRELTPKRPANRLSGNKELAHLDAHARVWIEASPFVLLATADGDGRCDVSPWGGPPGWSGSSMKDGLRSPTPPATAASTAPTTCSRTPVAA